jgi:hypothetical protein
MLVGHNKLACLVEIWGGEQEGFEKSVFVRERIDALTNGG